jgi:translation elongation factor EF-Tu-like GTPase
MNPTTEKDGSSNYESNGGSNSVDDFLELLRALSSAPLVEEQEHILRQMSKDHNSHKNRQDRKINTPVPDTLRGENEATTTNGHVDTTAASQDAELQIPEDDEEAWETTSEGSTLSWLLDQYVDSDDEVLANLLEFHDAEEILQGVLALEEACARLFQSPEVASESQFIMPIPESHDVSLRERDGEERIRGIVSAEPRGGTEGGNMEDEDEEMGGGPYADGYGGLGRDVDEVQIAALVTTVLMCGIWVLEETW